MGNCIKGIKMRKHSALEFTSKEQIIKHKDKVNHLLLRNLKVSIKNRRQFDVKCDWISGSGMSVMQVKKKLFMSGGYSVAPNGVVK